VTAIRPERAGDAEAVRRVLLAAFETAAEADLVERLRSGTDEYLAWVAVDGAAVVGHVAFTPLTLDGAPCDGMGLAPLAVAPTHQRRGIGGALVRAGLAALRERGCGFVALLGHPDYYPRFGFEPASRYGLRSAQWPDAPDDVVMALPLDPTRLPAGGGALRYATAFDALD
jgi:putative acetyltransferase